MATPEVWLENGVLLYIFTIFTALTQKPARNRRQNGGKGREKSKFLAKEFMAGYCVSLQTGRSIVAVDLSLACNEPAQVHYCFGELMIQ